MSPDKSFNLFVYGTLRSPSVFRAVLGRRLVTQPSEADAPDAVVARRAVLHGYKIISPDSTYLYAVPDAHGRIEGYVAGPLPDDCLAALRRYEGRNYRRRRVRVATSDGREEAVAFLANLAQLDHSFGYAFRDDFKQEILLHEKIDRALLEAEQRHLHTDDGFTRRAVGELRGATIRDLVRRHFEARGISDYAIRHSLMDAPLPGFARIRDDPGVRALADNYLAIVVRQVVFNEIEERIRHDFRYELDRMGLGERFYDRTVSSLATLRMLNARPRGAVEPLDILVDNCLADLSFTDNDLVDFVRRAIVTADAFYDSRAAKSHLRFIENHMGRGYIPLGAELEFSNIGHDVIRDPGGSRLCDREYDGFVYFEDFALDVLTWKLGGHVDDHFVKFSSTTPGRRRGFFEVALGSLSIQENLSKPVTDDPWLLNQIIHETRRFYHISPHSVHISLQLRRSPRGRHRVSRDRPPPLAALKCLFALAGDLGPGPGARPVIRRLVSGEIRTTSASSPPSDRDDNPEAPGVPRDDTLMFAQVSFRHSAGDDEAYAGVRTGQPHGHYVQQFKFLRLGPDLNYELLTMALKGLQLGLGLGSFLTPEQYRTSGVHRRRFQELLAWGAAPGPLTGGEIEAFLGPVFDGLSSERRGRPAHDPAYISWAINQLRKMLHGFNAAVARGARGTKLALRPPEQ